MKWKEIPKIDAHVHIIPEEVHRANPDSDDEFAYATLSGYRRLMDQYNIRKAIIMPFNDPWLMSMAFTVDAVHQNLAEICREEERLLCFADVDVCNTPEISCEKIRDALKQPCFRGIKLHPNNSGVPVDDAYNDGIADCAVTLNLPLAVHSYPSSAGEKDRQECCAPARIKRLKQRHPGLKLLLCHLGGFQWEDALDLEAYFDISAILPDYVNRYGIQKTNAILRAFGTERLLWATDWPCSRSLEPAAILESYVEILDQMDFTEEEMNQIAHGNAETLFGIPTVCG